ncbi:hypothetical protein T07_13289 [Trichinella nelsoni]|uniref:Uncharacterized protein n=1 Tax=Trichinella nelsoni TaxID=6336 RepID=A0A0V0RIR2_9BILA|nr:hypothetical protein T07_13289 [Trichinella nelsoni]
MFLYHYAITEQKRIYITKGKIILLYLLELDLLFMVMHTLHISLTNLQISFTACMYISYSIIIYLHECTSRCTKNQVQIAYSSATTKSILIAETIDSVEAISINLMEFAHNQKEMDIGHLIY